MGKMASLSYQTELDFIIDVVQRAGIKILIASQERSYGNAISVSDKTNRIDLVTETDQLVEKFVFELLQKKFPDHKFIGEESFAAGHKADLTVCIIQSRGIYFFS